MDDLLCQLCNSSIKNGDEVMRCIRGKIQDGYDANELHVISVLWFHDECFNIWHNGEEKNINNKKKVKLIE